MNGALIKQILKWFFPRLLVVLIFLVLLNEIYKATLWETDVKQYSRVRNRIDSAFSSGADIYLGESSNTSFNPWTDTLQESIAEFLQYYFPERKIEAVTHEGYHPGLFKQMLNLLPTLKVKGSRTLWLGVNMRTCGPSAIFSGNEASNQREALFYSHRPPLITRIFMGLHFYDNRNEKERERLKFQWWRTQSLYPEQTPKGFHGTAMSWFDEVAHNYDVTLPKDIKDMQGAYIKEFAFRIDEENPRVLDLKEMVEICDRKGWKLIFHILPPNRYHAYCLFPKLNDINWPKSGVPTDRVVTNDVSRGNLPQNELLIIMDQNHQFLKNRFEKWGVEVVDNYYLPEATMDHARAKGAYFTDQWYPTEHYNSVIRSAIAGSLAFHRLQKDSSAYKKRKTVFESRLKQNNFPNWEIEMPLSDPESRMQVR